MTKRYDEPIEVLADGIGEVAPLAFRWRGRRYEVDEFLTGWRETTERWDPNRARDREYHRVLARPAGVTSDGDIDPDGFLRYPTRAVFDVYRDLIRGGWRLARIWD